jgi:D-alanyl-D-alanine carboxypeptidase/D-alanyl-D-alanine-endopeptidase (penicillin-binding protein 4)
MRRASLVVLVLSLVAALPACGDDPAQTDGDGGSAATSGSGGDTQSGGGGSGGGEVIPAEEDPFEPPPVPGGFSDAELADLKADIDASLGTASATYSALVVGLDSGQVVYEKTPDTLRTPASNTKLFTTSSALVLEGESARPSAGVYAEAMTGGAVQGDLVLVGTHDPSTTPWFADDAGQPLDALAEVLADVGVTSVTGNVVAQGEFVYEGNSLGTIDFPTERAQVATAFRQALIGAGISVAGSATTATGFDPPAGAMLLTEVPSVSFDVFAHAINVPSHNELADLLMHHLGVAGGGSSTYASGFATVEGVLDDLGVAHAGLSLNDGSGLSHDNLVSPRQIVDLFRVLSARSEWSAFIHSMAIAGLRGTIASRMTGPDTAGRFWGKTGTLTGVVALSGVLFHRHDGQRYVASFLANGVADSTSARAALDGAIGALAQNRKGATGLPESPRLLRVSDDRNGQTALVELEPVPGATGYLVWRSPDGLIWNRDEARLVMQPTHRTFVFGDSLFVRVTAVNDVGESAPSSVLAVRVSTTGPSTLFVDGNDRYAAEPVPENPLGWGTDAVVLHAAAIEGPFESASHLAIESGDVDLGAFASVDWALGRESTADVAFTVGEQERVRAFVEGAGSLFVSGSELGYALIGQGTLDDAAFAREVLGIEYVGDDAMTTLVTAGDLPVDVSLARFSKLGRHEVAYADVLGPATDGAVCLRYAGGAPGAACVRSMAAGGRVVALGFPLESLDDPAVAKALWALP